jgi:hypothetical protein
LQLTVLAGVGAGALAIPGIETAYWLAIETSGENLQFSALPFWRQEGFVGFDLLEELPF